MTVNISTHTSDFDGDEKSKDDDLSGCSVDVCFTNNEMHKNEQECMIDRVFLTHKQRAHKVESLDSLDRQQQKRERSQERLEISDHANQKDQKITKILENRVKDIKDSHEASMENMYEHGNNVFKDNELRCTYEDNSMSIFSKDGFEIVKKMQSKDCCLCNLQPWNVQSIKICIKRELNRRGVQGLFVHLKSNCFYSARKVLQALSQEHFFLYQETAPMVHGNRDDILAAHLSHADVDVEKLDVEEDLLQWELELLKWNLLRLYERVSLSDECLLERYDPDHRLKNAYFANRTEFMLAMTKALINKSNKIVVVTGAGISVASGIPDFRSPKSGLYKRISDRFPELPSPECVFDKNFFEVNPEPFYLIANELLQVGADGTISPSKVHYFIKRLELDGKLLRHYTQNIDTLEMKVGLERVVYCHGSFATAHCLSCKCEYSMDQLTKLMTGSSIVPRCIQYLSATLLCQGLIKPDVILFGEQLPSNFYTCLDEDCHEADLLIVIGTSMAVAPVSSIPDLLLSHVPQILINMVEHLDHAYDMVLTGDCQEIVTQIY